MDKPLLYLIFKYAHCTVLYIFAQVLFWSGNPMKLFKVERFERFENCYDTQDTVAGQINVRDIFKNVTQHLHLEMHYTRRKYWWKKGLLFTTHFITAINIARISWTQINRYLFSVLISENENLRLSPICKDKISTKKCKKLKKKGKCEDKKIWKKCMDTCQKCGKWFLWLNLNLGSFKGSKTIG